MINATNNPYPESPDPSPSKLDKGGYEGNAETLDAKIDAILAEAKVLIDNTLVGSSSVGSIVPSSVPPATGAVHAFATQAGTYTNWGGFVVPANTFAFISRSADLVFSISQTALDLTEYKKITDNVKIETWTAKSYASGDQVNHLGKDWVSNAAIVAGDIPGTSSKWVDRLSAYALASDVNKINNSLLITNTNTSDFASTSISPTNYTFFSQNPISDDSVLKQFKINGTAGTISILVINYNPTTGVKSIASETIKTIVAGINEFSLDIIVSKGQYIGLYCNTGKVKYKDIGIYSDYSSTGKLSGTPLLSNNRSIDFSFTIFAPSVIEVLNNKILDVSNTQNNNVLLRLNSIELSIDAKVTTTVTNTPNFASPSAGGSNYTFFSNSPIAEDSTLNQVKINGTAGTISILVINFNPTTGVKSIASETAKTIVSGINEIPLEVVVKKGQYVGVYFNTARIKYNSTGIYSDYSTTGKLVSSAVLTPNRNIDLSFTVTDFSFVEKDLSSRITSIPTNTVASVYDSEKTVVENETKFTGWDNTGFSVISNVMQSSADGQMLTSTKRYGMSNRVLEVLFVPTSSTSKFIIATLPREGAINSGSAFRVNLTNNKVEILSRYSGTIGTVVQSFTPSFTLTANVKYKFSIELNGRTISLKIAKENTSLGYKLLDDYEVLGDKISLPYGYTTYSTVWNYNIGTMQGSIRLINEVGGVKIISLLHTLKCSTSPLIYVCGDSITEGFSVDDNSKYGALLQNNYGKTNIAVSGIGGATSNGALIRIQSELLKLRPKYFIPYFGSNAESDSLFTSGMVTLIDLAISKGSKVILCTVPTNSALSTLINNLAISYNLSVVDFRSVLTNVGAVYPEYYNNIDANTNAYTDNLHPNPLGHYLMFNEIMKYI